MIKVIIVEDDPMVLEVNRSFLERISGFSLIGTAETGKKAIQIIEEKNPDLVLLDVYLPDFSGTDVLLEIRKKEIPVDVIMITAARDTRTVHQLFRFGSIDYLIKPFHFNRFELALNNYAKLWKRFTDENIMGQADIDNWYDIKTTREKVSELPKGLSEITMKQVMMTVYEQKKPLTAEELAEQLGMARVTVRRYLEYLEKEKKVNIQVKYGKVGRPSNYYFV